MMTLKIGLKYTSSVLLHTVVKSTAFGQLKICLSLPPQEKR